MTSLPYWRSLVAEPDIVGGFGFEVRLDLAQGQREVRNAGEADVKGLCVTACPVFDVGTR